MTLPPLALNGGPKAFDVDLPAHPIVGAPERTAVERVFERNQFSEFLATPGKPFLGGIEVRAFEERVARDSGCAYGVAYNSWTSGLHGAVAACGVRALEYVYVTPWSFTSSATCALMNNAIPVFVDVDPRTGNIGPEQLETAIARYPGGKALVLVHLFGLPADMDSILDICARHGIRIIEDAAQAPGATYKGHPIGSLGTCGGFSFTQSKTVMSGEGGVLVTNDEQVAEVARMVRNHGEVLQAKRTYNSEFLGMGYRMTEIDAAIGHAQWERLGELNTTRRTLNARFRKHIENLCDFITFPSADYTHEHAYYVTPLWFDAQKAGLTRARFCEALTAEGIPLGQGYVKPLYLQDLYQKRRHLALDPRFNSIDYSPGICPNAEHLHTERCFLLPFLRAPMGDDLLAQLCATFEKVIAHVPSLRD